MPNQRKAPLLSRLGDCRPGEEGRTRLLFIFFFLITAPAYIMKPVRESFLLNFDPRQFPYADLITAILISPVVSLNALLLQRLRRRTYVLGTFAFFLVTCLGFWALFGQGWTVLSFVYWFWSDVFIATSVMLFWIAVSDAFDPYQAKRLIGAFVLGGILGGVAGSLLSMGLVRWIGTRNLLLACPVLLAATLVAADRLYREIDRTREDRRESSGPARVRYLEGFRILGRHRYLRLLAGTLACAMIVGKLVDYQFKAIGKLAFPAQDARTSFLSTFNLGLLVVSAGFHLFLTSRVLRKSGIGQSLLVAPVLLLLAAAAVFAVPAAGAGLLAWAVLTRGTDKGLDNTLSQSARELLYIPAPPEVKFKAKIFIDMFVNKFSTGLAAVLFMALLLVLPRTRLLSSPQPVADVRWVSLAVIAFAVAWIGLGRLVARGYVGIVSGQVSRRWEDGEAVVAKHVDLDRTRLVFDTLQSRDRSATLYAMNLYDLARSGGMTPEVKEVLEGRTLEIRARSMGALLDAAGETLPAEAEEIMGARDFDTDIREIMALDSYRQVVGQHIDKVLEGSRELEVARMEAAKVLGLMEPTPQTVRDLAKLLEDASPEVLYYAMESAGRLRRPEFVPLLLQRLGHPGVGASAADALAAYGESVVPALREALCHPRGDPRAQSGLPAVLGRIGGSAAADLLLECLERGPESLEADTVAALYRIQAENPGLRFPQDRVRGLVLAEIHRVYHAVLEFEEHASRGGPVERPVAGRLSFRIKTVFDLLSLMYPAEEMVKAYQNLCQGTRRAVDYSLELLDNRLDPELKAFLFPAIEDLPQEEKVKRLRRMMKPLQDAIRSGP